uniref:CRIB domain-containing protein n=1 Tax=Setaria digitata TaxID=48799 RepID=A0A915PKG7_9BILA
MEQLEISEPVNFEHKIHIGVDSVHGYDENDNDLLRRILHETEQLFDCYSVRTLLAEECSTKNGRKSISFENKPHVSLVLLNNQKSGDPEMGHSDKKLAPKYINSKTKNPKRFTGNFGDTFIQKIQQRRERIAEESSEEESGNSEEEW